MGRKVITHMIIEIEKEEQTTCNVFPMRYEIIPKHIRLDTTTLVQLLFTKNKETNVII